MARASRNRVVAVENDSKALFYGVAEVELLEYCNLSNRRKKELGIQVNTSWDESTRESTEVDRQYVRPYEAVVVDDNNKAILNADGRFDRKPSRNKEVEIELYFKVKDPKKATNDKDLQKKLATEIFIIRHTVTPYVDRPVGAGKGTQQFTDAMNGYVWKSSISDVKMVDKNSAYTFTSLRGDSSEVRKAYVGEDKFIRFFMAATRMDLDSTPYSAVDKAMWDEMLTGDFSCIVEEITEMAKLIKKEGKKPVGFQILFAIATNKHGKTYQAFYTELIKGAGNKYGASAIVNKVQKDITANPKYGFAGWFDRDKFLKNLKSGIFEYDGECTTTVEGAVADVPMPNVSDTDDYSTDGADIDEDEEGDLPF